MNLILQAIKSLFRKLENKIDKDIVSNRSDWEQNDENGAGYIKNRPFYCKEDVQTDILPISNYQTVDMDGAMSYVFEGQLIEGVSYIVTFNDITETRLAVKDSKGKVALEASNNTDLTVRNYSSSEIEFFSWYSDDNKVYRLGLVSVMDEIKQIDEKFIPDKIKDDIDKNAYSLLTYHENIFTHPAVKKNNVKLQYANGMFFTFSNKKTTAMQYSDDGFTWYSSYMPESNYWGSIIDGDGKIIAVPNGITDLLADCFAFSEDGIEWIKVSLPVNGAWVSIAYGNGKFVALSKNSNIIIFSEDGINWTSSTISASTYISQIIYGNGKFIARGEQIVLFSEDGINWTEETAIELGDYYKIIYVNDKYFAYWSGSSSSTLPLIYYSEDCVNWTESNLNGLYSIAKIRYGNGKFVTHMEEGNFINCEQIYYSEDGINWIKIKIPMENNRHYSLHGIVYGNDMFVCANIYGNILQNMFYSRDGIHWSTTDINIIQNNERKTNEIRNLLLNGYILPIPSTASVGQTLRISEVDVNGKVTAIEAVDAQSSNLTLTDETTGKKYKLTVSDGNLTMTEVES